MERGYRRIKEIIVNLIYETERAKIAKNAGLLFLIPVGTVFSTGYLLLNMLFRKYPESPQTKKL
jgi:hypothetical protein